MDAGLDQVDHAEYISAAMESDPQGVLAALKRHRTVVDPTLALYELLARPFTQSIDTFEPGIRKVASELATPLNGFGSPPEFAGRQRARLNSGLAVVGRLHRAGIPIVAGTDQSVPGHSLHRELELYVKAGLSPFDALAAATIVPARVMKKESDSGTIEKGKRGDRDPARRQPARRHPQHASDPSGDHQRPRLRSRAPLAQRRIFAGVGTLMGGVGNLLQKLLRSQELQKVHTPRRNCKRFPTPPHQKLQTTTPPTSSCGDGRASGRTAARGRPGRAGPTSPRARRPRSAFGPTLTTTNMIALAHANALTRFSTVKFSGCTFA